MHTFPVSDRHFAISARSISLACSNLSMPKAHKLCAGNDLSCSEAGHLHGLTHMLHLRSQGISLRDEGQEESETLLRFTGSLLGLY